MQTVECGASSTPDKRTVALIFHRRELLYAIKNYCYIEGHIMPDSEDEVRHTVQDVGEEGNVDRVTRMLDLAHADLVERLYPFTQHEVENPVVEDIMREKPVYGVVMSVPKDFSQTTLNLLGKLIHELFVSTVMADWLSITNTPKAEVWKVKMSDLCARINQVRNFRGGRMRIRQHWLG